MRKLLLIATSILAISACKNDGIVPGPGKNGDVKLVESISIVSNEGQNGFSFEYDENNRVVKMKSLDVAEDYQEVEYLEDKIIITKLADHGSQKLISDCVIEGGNRITSNKFTEIYQGKTDEIGTLYYEYNPDGTLKKLDSRDNLESTEYGEYKKIINYTWSDGNLTDAKFSLTLHKDGTEMPVMTSTAKITYTEKENNKINLDLNWYILNEIANENYDYSGILGYIGTSSKNYIQTMEVLAEHKIVIEYVFDNDGYPTQIKAYDILSSGAKSLYETYDITYK